MAGDRLSWALELGPIYGIEVGAWFEYGTIASNQGALNNFGNYAAGKVKRVC